ncbi:MAG: HIT family protein [Opitutales bacterium]
MTFELHPTLASDTHILHEGSSAHLLLHRNAVIPWFILVPHTQETELCNLEPETYSITLDRCRVISKWIQKEFLCKKVNFGAIGNLVPQMHLHMVGRSENDECWPKPVWGNLETFRAYSEKEVEDIKLAIAQFFYTDS